MNFIKSLLFVKSQEEFYTACLIGNLEYMKTFNLDKIDIHDRDEFAFRWACDNNYFEVAKWLLYIGDERKSPIDIHVRYDYAFGSACKNGHLEVAKWLYELSRKKSSFRLIDIHAINCICGEVFYETNLSRHYEITRWILTLTSTKYIKENFYEYRLAKEELQNRKRSKLDLFLYLFNQKKFKKLLDMHAINIISDYI